jgi:hypothetical protein
MMPPEVQSPVPGEPAPGPVSVPRAPYRWFHKAGAVFFICVCLDLGLFLVFFPWTEWWDSNFFSAMVPEWHQYWSNLYVRGAVSGLGVVNLYISLMEILRLRRFAGR